jgi:GNAT superfamily N-acetyltransferase
MPQAGISATYMGEPPGIVAIMRIVPIEPDQYDALGALTVAAYRALPGSATSERYAAMLRDVAARVREAEVLVAVGEDGKLLGGVTYVGDAASEWAEFDAADEACFRMLAVADEARGQGVGAALVRACIDRARRDGKARLSLLTTDNMRAAHRLYERLGLRRAPESDMILESGLALRSYVFDLERESIN